MFAFRCSGCGCLHGWIDHPAVVRVREERRAPIVAGSLTPGTTGVHVTWLCPGCGAEHVNRYGEQPVRHPTPEAIRVRAYFLWEAADRPGGDGVEFWLRAEEELRCEKTFAMERVV
jgi:hypothetical protein